MAVKNLKSSHGNGCEPGNRELSRIKKADVGSKSGVSIRPHRKIEWLMVLCLLEQCLIWLTCHQNKCLLQDSQKDRLGFSNGLFNKLEVRQTDSGKLGLKFSSVEKNDRKKYAKLPSLHFTCELSTVPWNMSWCQANEGELLL